MIKNDTKQKQKSRSDESAKQEVFVSEKRSKILAGACKSGLIDEFTNGSRDRSLLHEVFLDSFTLPKVCSQIPPASYSVK